ncbi:MAG: FecR domain-containing protein, partial [Deltaproteobacteria bacterium]|nr:FecR domain-containing protein [Deltaproteobacteria bacterium]
MSPPTCREVERLLDDYGRGDLPRDQLEAVELHLAGCGSCREAAELWSGFNFALKNTDLDPLPPLVERRITVAAADAQETPVEARGSSVLSTRWVAGIAAAAALAAGVALFFALTPDDDATQAGGGVAEQAAEPEQPADDGVEEQEVAEAQPSATGQGRQLIEVDDVTNLWIEEGSAVRVEHLEEGLARFRLDEGRVVAEVGPHPDGFRFIVVTPSGAVEAKGTIFAVEVRPGSAERARVMRGVVEVRTKDEPAKAFLVRAGESGRVGDSEPAPLASREMERDVCLLRGCAVAGEPVEVASNAPQVPVAEVCEPAAVEADAEKDPAPRPMAKTMVGSKPSKAPPAVATAAGKGSGGAGEPPAAETSPDDWKVETLLTLALSQRRSGMYPMAAESYRKLIREHSNT